MPSPLQTVEMTEETVEKNDVTTEETTDGRNDGTIEAMTVAETKEWMKKDSRPERT
jgi:hypothetical protein